MSGVRILMEPLTGPNGFPTVPPQLPLCIWELFLKAGELQMEAGTEGEPY